MTKRKNTEKAPPVHPGEVLREEFMEPAGVSAYALAKALGVPQTRLSEILRGRRAITAETALLLARHYGTSPGFWMQLQASYDLDLAADRLGVELPCPPVVPSRRSA